MTVRVQRRAVARRHGTASIQTCQKESGEHGAGTCFGGFEVGEVVVRTKEVLQQWTAELQNVSAPPTCRSRVSQSRGAKSQRLLKSADAKQHRDEKVVPLLALSLPPPILVFTPFFAAADRPSPSLHSRPPPILFHCGLYSHAHSMPQAARHVIASTGDVVVLKLRHGAGCTQDGLVTVKHSAASPAPPLHPMFPTSTATLVSPSLA
ncbi:hypothetical protein FB451DRAFT_1476318 [Mycena latifolia]|nr:hypothetical protein FB451DRAFT_1476318 [Mycena latifolia]